MITVGIDEVGRGCWAGPVVAGAVVLNQSVEGLADSKVLSKKQREIIVSRLADSDAVIGLGWVDAATVDKIGLTEAVRLAMRRALEQIDVPYDQIIIDGHYNFLADVPNTVAIIKADAIEPAVSAASVAAKVARDTYMANLDERYAVYEFGKHVGYGTALHLAALQAHGVSDLHRRSFKPIKALLERVQ